MSDIAHRATDCQPKAEWAERTAVQERSRKRLQESGPVRFALVERAINSLLAGSQGSAFGL